MPSKPSNPPVTVTHAEHRVSRLLFTAILFALYPALDAVAYASTANLRLTTDRVQPTAAGCDHAQSRSKARPLLPDEPPGQLQGSYSSGSFVLHNRQPEYR